MRQCPACGSFNDPDATFCNQCATAFGRPTRSGRRSLRPLAILAIVQLALVALVVWVVWFAPSDAEEEPRGADLVAGEDPTDRGSESGVAASRTSMGETPAEEPPEEARELTSDEIRNRVEATLVVLELRGSDDKPLREVRAVLVSSDGSLLARFRPLLGAHGGDCRLDGGSRRLPIAGIVAYEQDRDLALLRVRAEAPLPALSAVDPLALRDVAAGDALLVFSGHQLRYARVEEPTFDVGGLTSLRLATTPPVAPETFLAVDASASLIGLCRSQSRESVEAEAKLNEPAVFVDAVASILISLDRPVSITLHDLTVHLWEGSFADLLARGRVAGRAERWADAIELLGQAVERARVEGIEESRAAEAFRLLRESYLAELIRLRRDGRVPDAIETALIALEIYPDDVGLWVVLAELREEGKDWSRAIEAFLSARAIDPSYPLEKPLENAFLSLSRDRLTAADGATAETALLEGLAQLPRSAILHLELGRLYESWAAHDSAIRMLEEARRLDPSLGTQVEILLEKIDDVLKQRDAIVIPIPEGSTTIRTNAIVDGRLEVEFVVDTGATYTSLPMKIVEGLGYDLRRAETIVVNTAAGRVRVPRIQLRSVDLNGYTVRNLQALVLPESAGNISLLGLNFLSFFRYAVDARKGEFRLERQ